MEANEVPGLIVIPVYDVKKTDADVPLQLIRGVRFFFYWKTDLNPNYETEKLLFLKIKNIKIPKAAPHTVAADEDTAE